MYTLQPINKKRPQGGFFTLWLFLFLTILSLSIFSCSPEDNPGKSTLFLKTGVAYTANGAYVPLGGKIRIGIQASGGGSPLTYLRIEKITSSGTFTQLDKGIYVGNEGFDEDFIFSKDTNSFERWKVLMMNADRDTVSMSFNVFRDSGSSYGDITFIPSITMGLQGNTLYDQYLDLENGVSYNSSNVQGHEADINWLGYYYVTSGLPSPSFTCPGYTASIAYYPELGSWPVKSSTVYDYVTSDNNLISIEQFDAAENDSLLVSGFKPEKVSGNCKYCYTGKVVPFKTQSGKYGMIKVIRADQVADGTMELSIKVQK
jgi:hypothetical protein